MKIAAAQTNPKGKNTQENIDDHCRFIERASRNGVQLIVFPEMSITGYEREKAKELAFTSNDIRLQSMKTLAQKHEIIVIAGAPIQQEDKLHIGSFILMPDGTEQIYTKQFLHDGEEIAFTPSFDYNPVLKIDNQQISLAICADITHPEHPAKACKIKSEYYLASIFFTPTGISEAHTDLSMYAKQYKMNVLMANFCGESYGFEAAGQSAFWNKKGELITQMNNKEEEGLLIVEKTNKDWALKKIITS